MVLADNGIRASTMGTSFRKTLLSLADPSKQMVKDLNRVGMSLDSVNPKIVGWETALKNIAPLVWDFNKNSVDMAKVVDYVGVRASQTFAILIRETAQGGALRRAIESTKEYGSALSMAEKQQEGLAIKFKNLADNIKNIALAIGDAGLTTALEVLVDSFKTIANWVEWLIKNIPLIQWAAFTTGAAAAGYAIIALTANIDVLIAKIALFTTVLLQNPIFRVAAIFGVAATALNKFIKPIEETTQKFKENATEIEQNISTLNRWSILLEQSSKTGEKSYTKMVANIVTENKKLADQLLEYINVNNTFNEKTAVSFEHVMKLAGGFEKYSEIINNALEGVKFQEHIAQLNELEKVLDKFSKSMKKSWDSTDYMSVVTGPSIDTEKAKQDIDAATKEMVNYTNKAFEAYLLTPNKDEFKNQIFTNILDMFADIPELVTVFIDQFDALNTAYIEEQVKTTISAYTDIIGDLPEDIRNSIKNIPIIDTVETLDDIKELKKDAETELASLRNIMMDRLGIADELRTDYKLAEEYTTPIINKLHKNIRKLFDPDDKITGKLKDLSSELDIFLKKIDASLPDIIGAGL